MNHKTMIVISLAATTLIVASNARGSTKQEQSEQFGYGSITHTDFTYTRSPLAVRRESVTIASNYRTHMISIERLDMRKRWVIYPEKKNYTEVAMETEQSSRDTERWFRENDGIVFAPPEPLKDIHPQVEGPGTPLVINGFPCRPYIIKRTRTFQSPENPKQTMVQTEVDKIWVTDLTPALARYRQDERSFNKAEIDKLWGGKDYHGGDPLDRWWEAQGHDNEFVIQRVILHYRDISGQAAPAGKSDAHSPKLAPPAWALEADPSFAGHLAPGDTAQQRFITRIDDSDAPAEAFEIPAGYKQVKEP